MKQDQKPEDIVADFVWEMSKSIARLKERIVAMHDACIDMIYESDLNEQVIGTRIANKEKRFQMLGHSVSLGGGGINAALTSAALGNPNAMFFGFLGPEEKKKADEEMLPIVSRGTKLQLEYLPCETRRNTAVQSTGEEFILLDERKITPQMVNDLFKKTHDLELVPSDWIQMQSFEPGIATNFTLLGTNVFLDSGYGTSKLGKKLLTSLCEELRTRARGYRNGKFIIASNEKEIENLALELNVPHKDEIEKGRAIAQNMSKLAGRRVLYLLHTKGHATVFDPDSSENWVVPTIWLGKPKRKINGGDTFAGAFLAAYAATRDLKQAVGFANIATTFRLSDDELPTNDKMREFVRRKTSSLMPLNPANAKAISYGELLNPFPKQRLVAVK